MHSLGRRRNLLQPLTGKARFFGLEPPREVLIKKQLLALQESELDKKTWSRLEDGTPLVTADQQGAGWLVLYHVGTDSDWSNLPLSGTFVEMLRRTINLAYSGTAGSSSDTDLVLPPLKLLDAQGAFTPASETTKALTISKSKMPTVSSENPPGFYGTDDGIRALNLFTGNEELKLLEAENFATGVEQRAYSTAKTIEFKSWAHCSCSFVVDFGLPGSALDGWCLWTPLHCFRKSSRVLDRIVHCICDGSRYFPKRGHRRLISPLHFRQNLLTC